MTALPHPHCQLQPLTADVHTPSSFYVFIFFVFLQASSMSDLVKDSWIFIVQHIMFSSKTVAAERLFSSGCVAK